MILIGDFIFCVVAFSIFIYIFLFRLIRRNDTGYLIVLLPEAIGITLAFIQIVLKYSRLNSIEVMKYLLCIIYPLFVILLELKVNSFTELLNVGISKIYSLFGNIDGAKKVLTQFSLKNKRSYKVHKELAKIFQKENDLDKAIDEYTKAIDINNNEFESYYNIIVLLNKTGKGNEAITIAKDLVRRKPDYTEASMLLGDLLYEKEDFKSAASVYMDALKYSPENFDIFYSLGMVYTRLNDFKLAKECYEKAAKLNHKLYGANYKLGQIALLYKDMESAEEFFIKSLYGSSESKSYFELAKIYMIKNEREKAINFLNKSIELDFSYLKIARDEPMFFPIKKYIVVPENENVPEDETPEKEEKIEQYLKDTYVLTRSLGKKYKSFKQKQQNRIEKNRTDYTKERHDTN